MNASHAPIPPEPSWLTGQILIAMPNLRDPQFTQSVIFICAHTPDGAMGVTLNHPLKKPAFIDLLRQLEIEPTPATREIRLGAGGPVDHNRGFVLHSPDWSAAGSLEVGSAYRLTANLEILTAIAAGGGPALGFLALGYAGWGPGQLDQEMLANAWLSVAPDDALIYDADHQTKWQRALAKLHIDPGRLSGQAGRA